MHNMNITNNSFPDEVKINLNMLGAPMLHRIGGHVDCADVITIYQCGTVQGSMELL